MSAFHIYTEDAGRYEDPVEFKRAYAELTGDRKLKVETYKRDEGKRLSLATGHLMVSVLRKASFDPEDVRTGEYGKPYLPEGGFFFSLANKASKAIMVTSDNDIGCDLEFIAEREFSQLVIDRNFFPGEKKILDSLNEEERVRGFFEMWTKKEAYGKLIGTGLTDAVLLDTSCIENGRFSIGGREFLMSVCPTEGDKRDLRSYVVSVCRYADAF